MSVFELDVLRPGDSFILTQWSSIVCLDLIISPSGPLK